VTGLITSFRNAAADWTIDGGSLQIRFLASRHGASADIVDAELSVGPRAIGREMDFVVDAGELIGGVRSFPSISKAQALVIVDQAISGRIEVNSLELQLRGLEPQTAYSEMLQRDKWMGEVHLQLSGEAWPHQLSPMDRIREDNALRAGQPPFDGVVELAQAVRLSDTRLSHQRPSITIRVSTPVDLLLNNLVLSENRLQLSFIAHTKFDRKKFAVAARGHPGEAMSTRKQIARSVRWQASKQSFREGKLDVELKNSESAIVMVTYAGQLVRRQWVIDPDRATNTRLAAMHSFDKELKQLRQALFESTDSVKFEQGVAALLFLLGFAPSPVLETQAPDLLVTTPAGALAVVECTTRMADVGSKLGKLVDRRELLAAQLTASGNPRRIHAFLVSSQTRAQVAADIGRTALLNITLITREDILQGLTRTRWPLDPDKLLEDAAQRLAAQSAALGNA
jgi:hypothetical protein